jgi:hypothetical protein
MNKPVLRAATDLDPVVDRVETATTIDDPFDLSTCGSRRTSSRPPV